MVIRRKRRKNPATRKATKVRRRKALSYGKHRVTLSKTRSGWKRPKRSRMGVGRKSVRVNRRRRRRNPKFSMKSAFSKQQLMMALSIGSGIVASALTMPILNKVLPSGLTSQRKYLGGVHVIAGLLLTSLVKNKNIKTIGVVIAGAGVYDLIAQNVSALQLPGLPTSNILADKLMPALPAPVALTEAQSASYTPFLGMSYERGGMLGASYQSQKNTVGLGCDDAMFGTDPYETITF